MKELSYLNKYIYKYKFYYLIGSFFILVSTFFAIIPAIFIRETFNMIEEGYSLYILNEDFDLRENVFKDILFYTSGIILAAIVRGIFMYLMRQTIIVASRKIEYDLKNEIYYHYQTLPLEFYNNNNTGDLMNRISEDVSKVRMYLGPALMYGLNITILILMVIPFMLYINPTLTFYSLLPLPLLCISIYSVQNIINKKSEEIQKSLSDLSIYVQETFSGIRLIKSFVREINFTKVFDKKSEKYKSISLKLQFVMALFFPIVMTLIGLSIIITVYVGALEFFKGNITIGNIAEFLIYVYLLTWPVTALGWLTSIIQRASASQKRINEFLNQKSNIISKSNKILNLKGKIEFKDVSFIYPDTGIKALDNLNFKVKAGESLGIIGSTGSGKSTIANSIIRLFDINKGKILIDDEDIRDYNISYLRENIGYVSQDVFLFSDTIANNITLFNDSISEDKIWDAIKSVGAENFINKLPGKIQYNVKERGASLSVGQRQLISCIRIMLYDPKIILLDEATSSVDTETEEMIQHAISKILYGRTSIVVAHRLSTIEQVDKIVVIEDGEVKEIGAHEKLMLNGRYYKNLYDMQYKNFIN